MADVKLEAVISAKDEASKTINAVGNKIGGLATTLGKFAIGAGIAATAAAGVFIKKSIDAAKEEEVAVGKVNTILKTLTGSLEEHKEAVDKAAKSAMNLGFDDEDASVAMAKLLQMTGDTTEANNGLRAAMDLARLKGIDLDTATQAVSMAYAGNVKVLKQMYGTDLPEGVKGHEALRLMLEKVEGQAETYSNTLAGAQEKAKVAFENLQEEVGKIFLPIMANMFGAINSFLTSDRLASWVQTIKNWFDGSLVPALQNVYHWMVEVLWPAIRDNVVPAWQKAYEAIKPHIPLLESIIKVVAVIAGTAVIGAIIVLSNALAGIVGILAQMIQDVKDVIDWFKKLGDIISGKKSMGTWSEFWSDFKAGLPSFKQMGGSVSGGRPYIVGERGPELFVPGQSGNIVPNNKMGGGGITVNFNNPSVRSDYDLQQLIATVKRSLNRDLVLEQLRV